MATADLEAPKMHRDASIISKICCVHVTRQALSHPNAPWKWMKMQLEESNQAAGPLETWDQNDPPDGKPLKTLRDNS